MKHAALGLALLALASVLSACAPGTGALLYCMAVDHDINRKCQ
jgi:hypothetical protein